MIQKTTLNRFLIYASLIFISVLFLIPAYMVIVTSLKSPDQITMREEDRLNGYFAGGAFFGGSPLKDALS